MTQSPTRRPASAAWAERDIPDQIVKKAEALGWSRDLVERALAVELTIAQIEQALDGGCTPGDASEMIARQVAAIERSFPWMSVGTELGVRVRAGQRGLRLGDLNVGSYGVIPAEWGDHSMRPRGAAPVAGAPAMGYSIFHKGDLWSENVSDLYEDAIQSHLLWKPATSIPWETMSPLANDVEASMAQALTKLSEDALLTMDMIGKWLPHMSYGYHEVKCYLSTLMFDASRHFEVYRKRTLASGHPTGLQAPGYFFHATKETRTWPEASLYLNLLDAAFRRAIVGFLKKHAHYEAEAALFGPVSEDIARQLEYGTGQARFLLTTWPDREEEMQGYLDQAENIWAIEWERDRPFREALTVIAGNGAENQVQGRAEVDLLLKDAVSGYLEAARTAGLSRDDRVCDRMRVWVG